MLDLCEIASGIQKGPEGLWISPIVSAVSYPEAGNDICFAVEDDSFWFVHRNRAILSVVGRFPPPGTFFDIGGGNGYVAKALQDTGREVVLVEPCIPGARNARQRGVSHVVRSTLKDAGFRPGALPAIGLFDVVEHVEDDRAFLSDVYAYLVPGGRVYLTVPAFQRLWSHEDRDAGHWRRYTLSEISRVVKNDGFEIEYATYFFSFLLLPIYLFRALPYTFGASPKKDFQHKTQKDHHVTNPMIQSLIGLLSRRELRRITSGEHIGLGASCLVVARKSEHALNAHPLLHGTHHWE
jgi:SAM-dependent methyltransferase